MARQSFLEELKRRHVYRVAAAYAVVGWLLIQVVTQVFPIFHLPDWVDQAIVLLILIGFPIALVLAWAFDATPAGIVKTGAEAAGVASVPGRRSRRAGVVVGLMGVLIAVITGAAYWHFGRTGSRAMSAKAAASEQPASSPDGVKRNPGTVVPNFNAGVTAFGLRVASARPIPAKSIAVLPFENLSTDKGNAYFADGMQDLILTKLADIGDLKVISRTSTLQYDSHPENLKQIGRQLGVAAILEGSVQKAGNQVLINVQLIDATTDSHVWAQSYTRTLDNIFGVEGEVAEKVATTLNAKLTATESTRVAQVPTHNAAAYDAYLRGLMIEKNVSSTARPHPLRDAEGFYASAVKLDPDFALAWAHLAFVRIRIYSRFVDRSLAFLAETRGNIDTALRLQPNLGDGYLALAQYFYLDVRSLDAAIPPLNKARELLPNNADVLVALSDVEERQGKWQSAGVHLRQAALLEPRSVDWLVDLAYNQWALREPAQARAAIDRALVLTPNNPYLIAFKARIFQSEGNLAMAQKLIDALPASEGRGARAWQLVLTRQYDKAIALWHTRLAQPDLGWFGRLVAQDELCTLYDLARQANSVRATCGRLIVGAQRARQSPADDVELASMLADAYAALGNKMEALKAARRNVAMHSYCSVCKPDAVALLAQIQARFGNPDAALAVLPKLLTEPAGSTVTDLRYAPGWDPLRKDPRFQALLNRAIDAAPAVASTVPPDPE
ncbi:MAG TPA: tetratricopeptide repeat protein [Rhodanobacteraceae bacterium]|nr:tetratricopeptide repeat protein [Rhodanobacteraceae bacterium]